MIAFPDKIQAPSDSGTLADTEHLGDEIARLAAHLHAATYHLLVLIREFDEREGWGGGGFLSCAHWLSWRTGISAGPAREKVRVARALGSLPKISEAMAQGELSFSKVRAMTRVASRENEADLVELARHATAVQVERFVRSLRRVDRLQEADEEECRHQSRYLRLYPDDDGTYVLRGRLDPEVGALLEKALEWADEELYRVKTRKDETAPTTGEMRAEGVTGDAAKREDASEKEDTWEVPTFGQRRADALGLLAERALAGAGSGGTIGRAERFQVVMHVEDRGHAFLADSGSHVPAATSRRLGCDAGVVLMVHDKDGRVLDVGRRRRTVPPAIRRALDYRDNGCRFPGCGCKHTDAHHITHWIDGGETKLDNLVLLCRRHHRAVHEGGILVEGLNKGGVRFSGPDGQEVSVVPKPPRIPSDRVGALVEGNGTRGIAPDEWTATPLWYGEPMDYGLAIDMFLGGNPKNAGEATPGVSPPLRSAGS